ncbi:hypothetical protein ACFWG0_26410 [Streptomyces yangpuensis]|uniref:hypothetical protein n=1 Tax=Streptomyces yangpuensis TaxID=1648182 RepID=UPI00365FA307
MQMPTPLADTIAFWRDLPRYPREVLLTRGHHPWFSAAGIAAVHVQGTFGGSTPPDWMRPVLIALYVHLAFQLTCWILHVNWTQERLWAGVECPICDAVDEDDEHDTPAITAA